MNKNVVMGVIAVLALGAAIFIATRGGEGDDPAEGMGQLQAFVCRACRADIAVTKRQWYNARSSGTLSCPQCGSNDWADAIACPHCNKHVETIGHGRVPSKCNHCDQDIGSWRDVGGDQHPPPG